MCSTRDLKLDLHGASVAAPDPEARIAELRLGGVSWVSVRAHPLASFNSALAAAISASAHVIVHEACSRHRLINNAVTSSRRASWAVLSSQRRTVSISASGSSIASSAIYAARCVSFAVFPALLFSFNVRREIYAA